MLLKANRLWRPSSGLTKTTLYSHENVMIFIAPPDKPTNRAIPRLAIAQEDIALVVASKSGRSMTPDETSQLREARWPCMSLDPLQDYPSDAR